MPPIRKSKYEYEYEGKSYKPIRESIDFDEDGSIISCITVEASQYWAYIFNNQFK